jgi:hypothetical protein
MGTSFNPQTVQSGFRDEALINQILADIRDDLENKVDRNGVLPNAMNADLDMGSNRLLNVAQGVIGTDGVNLNQVQNLATAIAQTIVSAGGSGQGQTTGDPITFNFGIASGSQGATNRTVFDLNTLFGVSSFLGLTVVVNGVVQIPAMAYSVNGTVVTFTESLNTDSDILFIYGDLSPMPTVNLTINNYDLGVFVQGTPDVTETLIRYIAPRRIVFPQNFTDSQAHAVTAATSSNVFSIRVEGVEVGTVTIAAAGNSGTFASAADVVVESGEIITLVSPGAVDATLANISFTLKGSRG